MAELADAGVIISALMLAVGIGAFIALGVWAWHNRSWLLH